MADIGEVEVNVTEFNGTTELDLNVFPNPFAQTTSFNFNLAEANDRVTLRIFDANGKFVAVLMDKALPSGSYAVTFIPNNLPSGVYLYTLQLSGQAPITGRMVRR